MTKLYCISCPSGCLLTVLGSGEFMTVEGNKCEKGKDFAKSEVENPTRTLTTTVRTKFPGVPVISVRTDGEIPKDKLMQAMKELSEVVVSTELGCGDVVLEDVAETGVSVIVTSYALMQLGAELENKNAELERRASAGGASAAMDPEEGIGIVRNPLLSDELGPESADGFVGAAGEAVGVEGSSEEEEGVEEAQEDVVEEESIKRVSRSHIKRK